jgi:hypothetical protein
MTNPVPISIKYRPSAFKDAQGNVIPASFQYQAFRGDYTGTNLIYQGLARPGSATSGAVWQICKMTYDGSNNRTAIQWPQTTSGTISSDYEFVWDNRASYTYA